MIEGETQINITKREIKQIHICISPGNAELQFLSQITAKY